MGYLTDADLVRYLKRCRRALNKPGGFIFVKENVMPKSSNRLGFEIDADDNGLTRSDERYRSLFSRAGLDLVCSIRQSSWPSDLYPVQMYVLRPREGIEG